MDSWVDILEVIGDRCVLNKQNLCSTLESAKNCNRIALISIIGQRNTGKTFFIKCLNNYFQCNNRENWPNVENAVIYMNDSQEDQRKYSTIRLSSQPIILKEEISDDFNEIAVFLMDANFSYKNKLFLEIKNILSLFLLTSSTVIYNQKFFLEMSDFTIIENIMSRISKYDNSSNLIEKVWFVIRDWNPENKEYNLGFGAKNGKNYLKYLLKSKTLSFDKSSINCYLMPSPENDIISSVEINLSKLNDRFKVDLKSIITIRLLNTDNMKIKTKPNSEEPIQVNELIKLFTEFVEDMNNKSYTNTSEESKEYMNLISNISVITNSNQTNENKYSGKCAAYETSVKCLKPIQEIDKCTTGNKPENIERKTLETIVSDIDIKNKTKTGIKTGINLLYKKNKQSVDKEYQTISNPEITSTVSETLDDRNVKVDNSNDNIDCFSVSKISDERQDVQNYDYIISDDDDDYETEVNEADKQNSISELADTSNSNLNDLSFSFDYNKLNELLIAKMSAQQINDFENSDIIDMKKLYNLVVVSGEKINLNQNPIRHRDVKKIDANINESAIQCPGRQRLNFYEQPIRDTFEINLSEKVQQLFVDFKTNIERKINYQNFDLENGLQKAYKDINQNILKTFSEQIKSMPSQEMIQNIQYKHFNKLKNMIDQSFVVYEKKVQEKLLNACNEYEKAMKKSIKYYEDEMKSKIKAHTEDASYKHILNAIHIKSQDKAIKNFSDETNNFHKKGIEGRYLNQLNKEMNQLKIKFDDIFNYLNQFESKWKEELKTRIYLSETKLKEFYEKEKQSLNNKMTRYENSVLTEIALLLLEKSFTAFKVQNEENNRHENNILLKAVDLALNLYKECLQTKIKSNLYLEKDIKAMHNILFKHTLDSLLIACNFNEDQKDLRILCENTFKSKIGENYDKILAENRNLFQKITNAKRDALKIYYTAMTSRTSQKKYFKTNEFNDIHYKCSKLGFDKFNEMIERITKDFDSETNQKIFLENQTEIRLNITAKKDYFKSLNNKNAPKTSWLSIYFGNQYMSAATYDKKVNLILDKNNKSLRPNVIAFEEKILCGFEAQKFYRNKRQFSDSLRSLNLKQFFGKDRKLLDKEVLSKFPLTFCENNTNVMINFHELKLYLSIESLLALLLIDVKSDAENVYKSNMSNVVITYPSNYTSIQKINVRNVAKIAGFDEITLISELNAIAISYCLDQKRRNIINVLKVLIVVINEYDCDIGVCNITYNKQQFMSHCYQNLIITDRHFLVCNYKSKNENNIKPNFDSLIQKCLKDAKLKPKDITEYIIAGDSPLINNLKNWITLHFDCKKEFNCDPIKIITDGCTLYSAMLSKSLNEIEISQTSLFVLHYKKNFGTGKNEKIIDENAALPCVRSVDTCIPSNNELPLKITIFEGNNKSVTYIIKELPQPYDHNDKWEYMNYKFIIDKFGDIRIKLIIYNSNRNVNFELNPIVIESEAIEHFIVEEQHTLNQLNDKLELIKKAKAEESTVENTKISLIDYCNELKKKFENNSEMRSLIKRQILREIDETLHFLDAKILDLKILNNQRQKLDNTLKNLIK